jgi:multiple antibiotic resistance protein
MTSSLAELGAFALSTFTTLLFVVDPAGVVPLFLSITANESPSERQKTALRACIAAFFTLSTFAFLGGLLFRVLGISLGAFRIAGGILLFLLAVDMLQAKRTRTSPEEEAEGVSRPDVSVFPLAIPMLAGPGASSTVMVLVSRADHWMECVCVAVVIAVTAALCYWVLRSADMIARRLGRTGMNVLERVMGLILAATAVQFVIEGVRSAFATQG